MILTGARTHSSILAAQFADAPHPADREAALARISDWASELAPGDAVGLYELLERYPLVESILAGIVEASPYLFDLIRADGPRFINLLRSEPQAHLSDLIDAGARAVAHAHDEAEAMTLLRALKGEAALLIALCDIGGVWSVAKVSQALTDLADTTVQAAVRFLLRGETQRGRLTPKDPQHPEQGCGLIVLAMGKMGAGELNYSSDIDLIVFYNAETSSLAADIEPQPFFVRLAQGIARLLHQRTGEGYVFRVDLRLRPDPASTQVAISTAAALDYYEREGRTWERAAMIKARPCAGDLAAGAVMLDALSPFVWRRHLDYAALADVHDMKRQMHAYKGHSEIAVEGHNVKLGRGGIREIEFFAQTQQLIAGGRHPELRTKRTLEALNLLVDLKWIDAAARDELTEAYAFLRRTEHRLQMMADEQTHTLPEDAATLERFAHFLGFDFARCLCKGIAAAAEPRPGAVFQIVRGHSGGRTSGRFQPRSLGHRRARLSRGSWLQAAGRGRGRHPEMAERRLSRAEGGGLAAGVRSAGAEPRGGAGALERPGRRHRAPRSFPRGAATRRQAVLAPGTESRPAVVAGGDPRRRTATVRHAGAAAAGNGRPY